MENKLFWEPYFLFLAYVFLIFVPSLSSIVASGDKIMSPDVFLRFSL